MTKIINVLWNYDTEEFPPFITDKKLGKSIRIIKRIYSGTQNWGY